MSEETNFSDLRRKYAHAPKRPPGLRFFPELGEKARGRAIGEERENPLRCDSDDAEFLTEDFRERLAGRGFEDTEVYWSLGHCQGDGVAFYGRVYPDDLREKDAKAKRLIDSVRAAGEEIFIEITGKNNHYHHLNSMRVEIEYTNQTDDEDLPARLKIALPALRQELEDYLADTVREISREFEKSGCAEIDYRYSDEAIRADLSGKENLYDKNGILKMSEDEFFAWRKAHQSNEKKSCGKIFDGNRAFAGGRN